MNILRKALLVFTGGLFALALWLLAVDIGLVKTFSQPDNVKKMVADSGLYGEVVPGLLEQIAKENPQSADTGEVPLTNPIVKEAAQEAFSPQFLQTNVESIIDSLYNWLEGKTAEPEFNVNLEPAKLSFANLVAQKLEARLKSLPACPAGTQTQNFDYYNATCLPRGTTAAAAAQQVKGQVNGSQDFLADTAVTPADIKQSNSNQSIFEGQLKDLPQAWEHFKRSPIYLAVLAVLLSLVIILLSQSRRRGIKRVGITLLAVGIIILIFSLLLGTAGKNKQINLDNKALSEKLNTLIEDIANNVGNSYMWLGGIYTALGLAAVAGTMFVGRAKGPTKPAAEPEAKAAEPVETKPEMEVVKPIAKPAAKPKAKPKTRKIDVQ